MNIESRLDAIEREAESLPLRWGGSAISTRSVKALVAVARRAEKYVSWHTPDPDGVCPICCTSSPCKAVEWFRAALRALEDRS